MPDCDPEQEPGQRERDEVDLGHVQAGGFRGLDVAEDRLADRGDKEAVDHRALLGLLGRDRVEVEQRVVDRHRQQVLHLEGQLLADAVDRLSTHDVVAGQDAVVAHAEDDVLGAEPPLRPQLPDAGDDRFAVDHLTLADCPVRNRDLVVLHHGRPGSRGVFHLSGAKYSVADVESHHSSHRLLSLIPFHPTPTASK